VEREVTALVNQIRLIHSAFEATLELLSRSADCVEEQLLANQGKSQHYGRRPNQRKRSGGAQLMSEVAALRHFAEGINYSLQMKRNSVASTETVDISMIKVLLCASHPTSGERRAAGLSLKSWTSLCVEPLISEARAVAVAGRAREL
jgi:hypothetical protein